MTNWVKWFKALPPPGMLACFYAVFIAIGACVLRLPVMHNGDVGFGEALFTSVSAVTVTGLIVVDTGSVFTIPGQIVIAILIQIGGLGLMTFAVLLLSALGITIGMPQRMILREDLNQTSMSDLSRLVRVILFVALAVEAAGAVILTFVFVPDEGWGLGIWHAIFHSVSAFNNAGFSTFRDSLMGYAGNLLVTVTICSMFIISGLGFVVIAELLQKRDWRRLSLHSKLMLAGTAVLIVMAWVLFAALEWNNPGTLGRLGSAADRIEASFFQAVTPRTAGFNSIDTTAMRDSTALMTISLMLIGGGSTSTAGGIKVTTAIVLVLGTIAFFRRSTQLTAFGRSIGLQQVLKVMALTTISILLVFVSLFLLTLSHDVEFLTLGFEVASAFGTVGLSMGATGELDTFGRVVIMMVMFAGRVGPLALGFFLATRVTPRVRYPAGEVYLG
ncbi:TrkH family potassium uptake protein [Palleronia sp. LCG004]|uniref:TrkH family potassium uptake protein n=1 Tax=Palleronia sp. LCG004 TaxID=3079304 RepID=UPI002942FA03|nr:TrkH family potassium uptake protein [Palleronia sp. LCG004]WOI55403.1 TrkH family potassium uptake protein [Palleronia sp. LCG004]